MSKSGTVYLVGAGPGDAGLLTLRGAELLRRADVVIYDVLVNRALLHHTRPEAELIARGSRQEVSQKDLTALIIARARAGKCVVRLKGGDPYIFGRGGEEAGELAAAKIPFEVVPGVSSVVAAPNYAGIPLTHRDHCSSFTVFTGHGDTDDAATALRYEQIAKIPGTKVVLMGMREVNEWAKAMVKHGLPKDTPVAMIRWGTTGRQQTLDGTLGTIAALAEKNKFTPPVITIIGDVVKLRGKLNWFENRPLFGQRVVVTRARNQSSDFAHKLSELGADVLELPIIKISAPGAFDRIMDALLELNTYDWLVFTSPNGVTEFFNIFFRAHEDMRDLGGARIAAVGPVTAAKLKELHLQVDLMPPEALASKIAAAFAKYQTMENVKVCLIRAEKANPELPKALEALGAIVDDIACYRTEAETEDPAGAGEIMLESGADWITFTSASTVEHFHTRFNLPKFLKKFPQTKLATIGPETTKALKVLGLEPALESKVHTTDGLTEALLKVAGK